jgi:hypothetical protein
VRGIFHFVGANLFIFGLVALGAGLAVGLVNLARFAGADEATVHWLIFPVGVVAVVGMYVAAKVAHRVLARLI